MVWVLVGTGVVLGCDWDRSLDPDQDLSVINNFMIDINQISEVSDPESWPWSGSQQTGSRNACWSSVFPGQTNSEPPLH